MESQGPLMKTDKQVFLIFRTHPEWFFVLIGKPSPGKCRMRSVTFKELHRTTDGLIEPIDESQDLTISEFQFQMDREIYLRVVEEMSGAQRLSDLRGVRGVILFADASLDPKTEPWRQVVETYVLRDCLEDLERREPQHPLVSVFKPLLERNDDVLQQRAAEYYRNIKDSRLKAAEVNVLLDVFVDWLRQRQPQKSLKEIEMLLFGELTPLEETVSGKELIQIGVERGQKIGVERGKKIGIATGEKTGSANIVIALLESKFARVPRTLQSRIHKLDVATLKALSGKLLTFERIQEVKQWLDSNGH